MNVDTSSAARKAPKEKLPTEATILAVIGVSAVSTMFSPTVMQLADLLVGEKSGILDGGWFRVAVSLFRRFLGAAPRATAFVLIFWYAKGLYLKSWVIYGFLWSFVSLLSWVMMLMIQPSKWAPPVLALVLAVASCMLSAFLTHLVFSRTES